MGLFDKKCCGVCGAKLGLFGTSEIGGLQLCSDCADRISPWFDTERHGDAASIRAHLEDREQSQEKALKFHTTREFGDEMYILLDEESGQFIVTDEVDLEFCEPDVFSLNEVTDCRLEIEEEEDEIFPGDDEDPRECDYSYLFHIHIMLDHPYIEEISFPLFEDALELEYVADAPHSTKKFNPEIDPEYRQYLHMANEIVEALGGGKTNASENISGSAPLVTCPYCGAKSRKTPDGCCEHCGGNLDD